MTELTSQSTDHPRAPRSTPGGEVEILVTVEQRRACAASTATRAACSTRDGEHVDDDFEIEACRAGSGSATIETRLQDRSAPDRHRAAAPDLDIDVPRAAALSLCAR